MEIINRLDNSMISDYRRCPRYFQFRHIEHLVPKSDTANYKAQFGTALHEALASWYTDGDPIKMDRAFIDSWAPFDGQDDIRTTAKGLLICEKYRSVYFEEAFEIVEIEISGAIDLGNLLFMMRSDLLVRYTNSGKLVVFEHKTSAHKGYLIPKPNSQITGYMYCVNEFTTVSEVVDTAVLNVINFRKGRAGEDQLNTIEVSRLETTRSPNDFTEWRKDVQWWANEIANSCKCDHFPMNTDQCTAYGRCQYLNICSLSSQQVRESTKTAIFKKEKWAPFPIKPEIKSDQQETSNAPI